MEIITNESGLITINATLFIQVASFLIFLFIINRLMFRPLRNTMLERDVYIATTRHDIVNAEKEIDNITSQLKQREKRVRKEALEIQRKIEVDGDSEAEKIESTARKEIVELREKTMAKIHERITEAKKDLTQESELLAISIMEKILDRRLS